ncbi:peptidylprolyl isomerase [Novosphingobium sp. AAP93]|uniref:peptidylprolyl isomerase n=1 Tax=Novosphingobium sp. AAP93 TaxID=1523427 RepID=UPI0006B8FB10|nr:peptidylprolyl isomerase [Novosphingobium sp. AAP93]KPF80850.1 peptidylprolyl isomerase [Novosphingobium sp. AAP93]
MKHPFLLSVALLASCNPAPAPAPTKESAPAASPAKTSALAPTEIVAAAPAADWAAIAPSDLLVMDLAPDAKGAARRVVIQLLPAPFSQGWIGNIRKLAAAKWWDGTSVNRVQDGYVVQWGDPDGEDKAKAKPLPAGLKVVPAEDYEQADAVIKSARYRDRSGGAAYVYQVLRNLEIPGASSKAKSAPPHTVGSAGDSYAAYVGWESGWPVASDFTKAWPIHCYGTVGVGRDYPPDTGSGAELYAVIGQAPRQLDRNIAVVGRVIEGIENLSSLPRGTGDIGFYKTAEERTPILSIRIGTDVPGLPRYEYLSTESKSFAAYADARANRRDAFYIKPAGGVDICNVPVPVRRVK